MSTTVFRTSIKDIVDIQLVEDNIDRLSWRDFGNGLSMARLAKEDERELVLYRIAADAATRLEEVNERIQAIEGAGAEGASSETVQLRREAAQLGRRIEQLTSRAAHLQERLRRLSGGEGVAAAGG